MKSLQYTTTLIFLFILKLDAQVIIDQPTRVTDGVEYWEYSEEELFKFLKRKYIKEWIGKREFSLKQELSENIILVRLFDNSEKIAGLKKAGRNELAKYLVAQDRKRNLDLVDGMLDFYELGKFYFYYPKDSHAIFAKGDFSLLKLDELTPVKDIPDNSKAYVLMYKNFNIAGSLDYNVHYWDWYEKKMIRLKKHKFRPWASLFGKEDHYKTIEHFCTNWLR